VKPKRKEIRIRVGADDANVHFVPVTASVYDGSLAIHPRFEGGPWFAVSHPPTGYAVGTEFTFSQAREVVKRLLYLNWNFTDAEKAPKRMAERARKIVREVMNGTKAKKERANAR
jgi:hypothetical protein